MTKTEAMKQLKANGSEQTRKTYRRHGVRGKMFGVSYAVLGKMKKQIKVDQGLAEQLWATDNLDARALATMVADPGKVRVGTLNTWVKESGSRGMAGAVSNVAAGSPHAQKLMEKWTASRNEMIACAGWPPAQASTKDRRVSSPVPPSSVASSKGTCSLPQRQRKRSTSCCRCSGRS